MSGLAPSMKNDGFEALPEALSELIGRVIRGTRLWPSEKRDVRAELESHFREGLIELTQEGLTVAESVELLRDGFGDPETAAILIRRGKKRGRSMLWKIIASVAMVTVGVLGAGAGYVAYVQFGKPNPTVDYVARINEPIEQTPEGDRAWPAYREVILAMNLMPELKDVRSAMPSVGDAGWAEVLPWVTSNRHLLPRIMEAARRPAFGYVYDNKSAREYLVQRALSIGEAGSAEEAEAKFGEDDPLSPPTVSLLLPHLSDIRDLGRLLILSARDRISHDDFAGAWGELVACYRMGIQLLGGQTLLEQLVGVSLVRLSTVDMRQALMGQHVSLSAEALQLAESGYMMATSPGTFRPNLAGERLFFHDCVQYLFTDDGKGNGRLIPSQFDKLRWMGVEAPADESNSALGAMGKDAELLAIAAAHADRRETLEKHQELWERMNELLELPLYDTRRDEVDRILKREVGEGSGGLRFALIGLLLPNLTQVDRNFREAAMDLAATQTVIALVQYHTEHGSWPARLSDLVPIYLDHSPIDTYTGVYLRYKPDAGGVPLLYSVGRDLQDDGGSTESVSSAGVRPTTRDIVYWPATSSK